MPIDIVSQGNDDEKINKIFSDIVNMIGQSKMKDEHYISALANTVGWMIVMILRKKDKRHADAVFDLFMTELAGAVQKNGSGYKLPWAKFQVGLN